MAPLPRSSPSETSASPRASAPRRHRNSSQVCMRYCTFPPILRPHLSHLSEPRLSEAIFPKPSFLSSPRYKRVPPAGARFPLEL